MSMRLSESQSVDAPISGRREAAAFRPMAVWAEA
jgi:hypothetical protein